MTTAGDLLRAEGQQQAEQAADPRVTLSIDAAIAEAIASGEPFSCNDLRDRFPVARSGLVGARVDAARKRGEIVAAGWVKSTLPSTRSHAICVWRGVTTEGVSR